MRIIARTSQAAVAALLLSAPTAIADPASEIAAAVAGGEVLAKAETNGHREFQFWAGEAISL